jgi:hypothetical protein
VIVEVEAGDARARRRCNHFAQGERDHEPLLLHPRWRFAGCVGCCSGWFDAGGSRWRSASRSPSRRVARVQRPFRRLVGGRPGARGRRDRQLAIFWTGLTAPRPTGWIGVVAGC